MAGVPPELMDRAISIAGKAQYIVHHLNLKLKKMI
jgi:hypothetical protein